MGLIVQDSESRIRKRIIVKAEGRILFLAPENIKWLEAQGNYVKIYTDSDQHLIRGAISALEVELDPSIFLRISRSVIINMNYVREMQPWFRGNYRVIMIDGTEVTLTSKYRERLDVFIGVPVGRRSRLG